ncbi:MAG: 16S rRNA (uracil(1498)-N(3))-methyltransferase [Defluviitaleaceae bacterium]|nr:16S rRNA (uracil(1498)-N(3))-methyltransferase [Defluviitaleaceae bacterium]
MYRFFVDEKSIGENEIRLTGENASHAHVLRLRVGEEIVTTVSGSGTDHICAVTHLSKNQVTAKIVRKLENPAELPFEIVLYQALPKGNKMNDIIEHVTELGVARIVPIVTARCTSRPADDAGKVARWQKIAESAAKLCHRGRVPQVDGIMTLEKALNDALNFDTTFVCYELEKARTLAAYLSEVELTKIEKMAFFVGSEGGFSREEAELFTERKIPTITLGSRILRCQSAAAAVLAGINYHLQGLDL